ncbi:MAG: alpha/beta fold hydrolase [Chthoniobacterales bacterium]
MSRRNPINGRSLGCLALFAGSFLLPLACSGATTEDRFAQVDGMKVHYTNRGSGRTALVFVHGWNCDLTFWKHQVAAFPQTRVIAIDLPGHGESDKPEINYTMDLHARAIDGVLREAGVEEVVLVGHSNGTPVIRQFYRRFPEKTRGLVIVDGALRPFAPAEQMQKFIAPMRAANYRDYFAQLADAMTRPMKDDATREQIKAAMARGPQHVAVSEMESLLADDLWRADKINVPTLVILAKQPAWNADYERFVRNLAPDLDYQVWEGVSHFVMMDKPQEFNAAVAAFLAKYKLFESRVSQAGSRPTGAI